MASARLLLMFASVLAAIAAAGPGALAARDSAATEEARAAITDYARLLMAERKATEAFAKYYAPGLIQHDPWIDDGGAADEEFLEARRKAEPDKYAPTEQFVTVVHTILAEGDLVAIKSHVFTSPTDQGRVFVDIWRLENGRFAEHWDVIQPLAEERDVGCGAGATYKEAAALANTVAAPVCGAPDRAVDSALSRKLVLDYLAMGQQPGRLVEAIETYVAEDLKQHSARIPPSRQGLIDYMTARAAARAADNRASHIARVIADGDLVLVHRRVTTDSDPRGTAVADLFRVRDGRVIEHWDVVQPIPDFSVSGRAMVDGPLEPGRYKGGPRGSD
jgi:predicted SnoaL-like aldol condensation-catalyzing enzyme